MRLPPNITSDPTTGVELATTIWLSTDSTSPLYNRTTNTSDIYPSTDNDYLWRTEENSTTFFDPGGTTDQDIEDSNTSGMSEDWKVILIICGVEVFFYLGTLSIIYVLRKVRDRW